MNENEVQSDNEVIDLIDVLRNSPDRDPMRAASGRERFLEQARYFSQEVETLDAVSFQPDVRHKGWITQIHSRLKRKERYSMYAVMTTVMILFVLVFGGGGATVYASQVSLPDQVLYPMKTASEDMRLSLEANPQARLDLVLEFTDRRVSEFAALIAAGEPAPQETADRLKAEYALALQLAAGMDDGSISASLERIRSRLQDQDQIMQMLQEHLRSGSDPVLERVQAMIRRHLADLEEDVQTPETFRRRMQLEYREAQATPPLPATFTPQSAGKGYGPGPGAASGTPSCGECTPVQDGTGPGPDPIQNGGTPEPPGVHGSGAGGTPPGEQGGDGVPGNPQHTEAPGGGQNGGGQQGRP